MVCLQWLRNWPSVENIGAIKLLVKGNPDALNIKNKNGQTPLDLALPEMEVQSVIPSRILKLYIDICCV